MRVKNKNILALICTMFICCMLVCIGSSKVSAKDDEGTNAPISQQVSNGSDTKEDMDKPPSGTEGESTTKETVGELASAGEDDKKGSEVKGDSGSGETKETKGAEKDSDGDSGESATRGGPTRSVSWTGNGTSENPYEIDSYEKLCEFANIVNGTGDYASNSNSSACAKLTSNIDCTGHTDWVPIGTPSSPFKGRFNGDGHTIKNLSNASVSSRPSDGGLFGEVFGAQGSVNSQVVILGGIVENVGLENVNISGSECVGGIAGYMNGGLIDGCYISGVANISAENTNSYSNSEYNNAYVGGIAGRVISRENNSEVGYCVGNILNCYNCSSGNMQANSTNSKVFVGGIAGAVECGMNKVYQCQVLNCYSCNVGAITTVASDMNKYIGATIGYLNQKYEVKNCYFDANRCEVNTAVGVVYNPNNEGFLTDVTGLTTAQMTGSSAIGTGATQMNFPTNKWFAKANDSDYKFYPQLKVFTGEQQSVNVVLANWPPRIDARWTGSGSSADQYQIDSYDKLREFANIVNGTSNYTVQNIWACANLMSNIEYTGNTWVPIGDDQHPYSGTFNGVNHSISLLNNVCASPESRYAGLFGYVGSKGSVQNVFVSGVIIGGNYDSADVQYVGGIAGYNEGTISQCSYRGSIIGSGKINAGGIVGYNGGSVSKCCGVIDIEGRGSYDIVTGGVVAVNDTSGNVENCYHQGDVIVISGANVYVGGVVGDNKGTVTMCYQAGDVSGKGDYVGGVIGYNRSSVSYCYYDTDRCTTSKSIGGSATSGVSSSVVLGLTTANMCKSKEDGGIFSQSPWKTNWRSGGKSNVGGTYNENNQLCNTSVFYTYPGLQCFSGDPEDVMSTSTEAGVLTVGFMSILEEKDLNNLNASAFLIPVYAVTSVVELNADINLSSAISVGTSSIPFSGIFNGKGHTISGNSFDFGVVAVSGVVKNLTMAVNKTSDVGLVATNNGVIKNCMNTGNITESNNDNPPWNNAIGGLVKTNSGIVERCINTGDISGVARAGLVGGVVGESNGIIQNCINTGNIVSNYLAAYSVGGILGKLLINGLVQDCYSTTCRSEPEDAGESVGGVVGSAVLIPATVKNCYCDGTNVSGACAIGGKHQYVIIENTKVFDTDNMTGTDAIGETKMNFSDPSVWITRDSYCYSDDDSLNYYLFYPHLKGFEYDTTTQVQDWIPKASTVATVTFGDTGVGSYEYDRDWHAPSVTVTVGESELDANEYTISYQRKQGDKWVEYSETYMRAGEYKMLVGGQEQEFEVTKKPVTITGTITAKDKEYDGNTNAELTLDSGVQVDGICDGDDVSVSNIGTFNNSSVGNDKPVTLKLTGTDAANYTVDSANSVTVTASITQLMTYEIDNCEKLMTFAAMVNGGMYGGETYTAYPDLPARLTADIDCQDVISDWTPITRYSGTFDGNNHKIKNLNISSADSIHGAGFFGSVASTGTVQNVKLENTNVNLSVRLDTVYVGALIGDNSGTVKNCCSEGTGEINIVNYRVSSYVGGLIGQNTGSVTSCYNAEEVISDVSGAFAQTNVVGGVIGYNNSSSGEVNNCYNTGAVTNNGSSSNKYAGGVIGNNSSGTITSCYNTGVVTNDGDAAYKYAGGVIGDNSSSTITSCYNTGAVTNNSGNSGNSGSSSSQNYAGGVAGNNSSGTITSCYNTGAVTNNSGNSGSSSSPNYAGGVVGCNSSGTVTSCYNTGAVTNDGNSSEMCSGGVVGYNTGSTIISCYNEGNITGKLGSIASGTNNYVGGVVGYNSATTEKCYNIGTVTGTNGMTLCVGGIAGYNDGRDAVVKSCYNTNAVTGAITMSSGGGWFSITPTLNVGGVVGQNDSSSITLCCYNIGDVTDGSSAGVSKTSNIGGIIGKIAGTGSGYCYYNTDTMSSSTINPCGSGTAPGTFAGLTTAQMTGTGAIETEYMVSTYTGTDVSPWIEKANTDDCKYYPHLQDFAYDSDPTDANWPPKKILCFHVYNYDDLVTFATNVNNGTWTADTNAKLEADIVCTHTAGGTTPDAADWVPIGNETNKYSGTFDGQGHKIIGLSNNDVPSVVVIDYTGLFGYVGSGGIIQNVCVEGATIKGNQYVGAVAGANDGTIQYCYNTGEVWGRLDSTGGIVGANTGTIRYCYNAGEVTGVNKNANTGGVVGANTGTIQYCYNAGKVTGVDENVGGVVGNNNTGTITNCYYDKNVCTLMQAVGNENDTDTVKGFFTVQMTGLAAQTNMIGFFTTTDEGATYTSEVWLAKAANLYMDDTTPKAILYYPHLKGFNFNSTTGAQLPAEQIDAANWPPKIDENATITFSSESDSFTYNGTNQAPVLESVSVGDSQLNSNEYTISYQKYNEDNTWTAVSAGKCIDAGSYKVLVGEVEKEFSITQASLEDAYVTASLGGNEVTYNGATKTPTVQVSLDNINDLNASDYTIAYAYEVSEGIYTDGVELKDAGTYRVSVTGKGNYTGTADRKSYLTISKRELHVKTETASKAYDGTALSSQSGTISGVQGDDVVRLEVIGTQTEVNEGAPPTLNEYELIWGENTNKNNYEIVEDLGTLTVTKNTCKITIKAASAEKTYDGTPLTASGVEVDGVPEGFTVEATVSGTQTNAGSINNVVEGYEIKDADGEVRTENFTNVTTVNGTLKVNKAPLTITTGSASKAINELNGQSLGNGYVLVEGLVNNETVTVTATGYQENIGSSKNTCSKEWGTTNKDNYDVVERLGILTVTSTTSKKISIGDDSDSNVDISLVATSGNSEGGFELNSGDSVAVNTVVKVYVTPKYGYELLTLSAVAGELSVDLIGSNSQFTVSENTVIKATAGPKQYILTVRTPKEVKLTVGTEEQEISENSLVDVHVPYNANVKLSVSEVGSENFIGWFLSNGKLASSDTEFSFAMIGNADYTARYKDPTHTKTVTFKSAFDNTSIKMLTIQEGVSITPGDVPLPIGYNAYEFTGWELAGTVYSSLEELATTINTQLENVDAITVSAQYTPSEETLHITVKDEKASGQEVIHNVSSSAWSVFSCEGEGFSHWEICDDDNVDGVKVCTRSIIKFKFVKNCVLKAVYKVAKSISITKVSYDNTKKEMRIEVGLAEGVSNVTGIMITYGTNKDNLNKSSMCVLDSKGESKVYIASVSVADSPLITTDYYIQPILMTNGQSEKGDVIKVDPESGYDSSEGACAVIISHMPTQQKVEFVAYLSVPDDCVMVSNGVIAAPKTGTFSDDEILDFYSADYTKSAAVATGTAYARYTWTNTSVAEMLHVRPYVTYKKVGDPDAKAVTLIGKRVKDQRLSSNP